MGKILILKVIFFLFSIISTSSQEDPMIGTCSNTVLVLTKEEMKREIQSQITEVCNRSESEVSIIQKLEQLNMKLEATMNKLVNLYQPGRTASHPAMSCAEIYDYNPTTPSGYYWLKGSNAAIQAYCNMNLTCKGIGGGWMQVVKLNMTNSSHQCPPGTRLRSDLPKRLCGIPSIGAGCSSTTFDIHGIEYGQVCGKIIAYQDGSPDAFRSYAPLIRNSGTTIEGNYVDGVSLTHGRSPRKHIWTFVGALDEVGTKKRNICPCTNVNQTASATQPPSFVGSDYFCDTGSEHRWSSATFYTDDPLWDGAGCGSLNTCCSLNSPPWFQKQLPSPTADNIEMRMCRDQPYENNYPDEDTPLEILEIYVR